METRYSPSSNNGDRISNLPDILIHHILSFIDMKYVIQTSVLSRRWRYLWTSIPTLNLHTRSFSGNFNRFKDFVDNVFILRNSSDIQRLRLYCFTNTDTTNHLNTWILAAVRHNVKEISIDIHYDRITWLPESLFTCTSLMKLELRMRDMRSSKIVLPNSMYLPRLKSLNLDLLSFDDEFFFSKLFSSCPVLESFFITGHIDCMNLDFSSLKLKHFKLVNCAYGFCEDDIKVKLYAPNLTSFSCKDYLLKDYCLENLSSLVTADIGMGIKVKDEMLLYSELPSGVKELYAQRLIKCLRALHNVKDLTLSTPFLEVISGAPELLDSNPLQFCNLQRLKLETKLSRDCIHAITYLLKISPNVESLFLEITETKTISANVRDDWEAGLSLPCILQHLKFVEIRGVVGCVNELKFLEILLKNSIVLDKVVVFSCFHSRDTLERLQKFSEKLLSFPRASSSLATFFF